jgi:hypothetical protein
VGSQFWERELQPEYILSLLSRPSTDVEVIKMLQAHGAKKYRPALDEDDSESMTDWFPVLDLGIEFGFKDEAYLKGWDPRLRRKEQLIFFEVIYYGQHPRMASFQGELPFELEWTDSRAATQKKMGRLQRPLRSYVRDVWESHGYRLVISYTLDESAIADVIVYIPDAPWQAVLDSVPQLPSLTSITSLFGKSPYAQDFERIFRPFGVMYHLDELDIGHIIDVREEFGFELHFSESLLTASAGAVRVLVGIMFYRERDMDARQWQGELPFGIEWGDAPPVILAKVDNVPTKQFEDNMSGSMSWHFTELSLHVMYSMLDNLPYRITLSQPKQ